MANRHRGEIEAEIGGKIRRLRLTFDGMARLEDALGMGILQIAKRVQAMQAGAKDVRLILETALHGAGDKPAGKEVAEAIEDKGLLHFVKPCAELLTKAMAGADAGESARPPEAPETAAKP